MVYSREMSQKHKNEQNRTDELINTVNLQQRKKSDSYNKMLFHYSSNFHT